MWYCSYSSWTGSSDSEGAHKPLGVNQYKNPDYFSSLNLQSNRPSRLHPTPKPLNLYNHTIHVNDGLQLRRQVYVRWERAGRNLHLRMLKMSTPMTLDSVAQC
jgi:hypothetical protein